MSRSVAGPSRSGPTEHRLIHIPITLRLKLVVALASLATLATVAIGATSYRTTMIQLDAEVDRSLRQALDSIESRVSSSGQRVTILDIVPANRPARPRSFDRILVQVVDADGSVRATSAETPLPVSAVDVAIASGSREETTRSITIDGEPFRVLTSPVASGVAVQFARSTEEVNRVLTTIRNRTLVSVSLIVAMATIGGWLIANRATRRLERLIRAAEEVAETGRLDVPAPNVGDDEVGRLGAAFAEMLAALRSSREAQTQLVQDAGHELRTPLTSLRTNIALLRRADQLPEDVLRQVIADLDSEARELSALVDEIVELATEQPRDEPEGPVDLADLARVVADRAGRRTGRTIDVAVEGRAPVTGRAGSIERALSNLIDNAAKFSEPDSPIEVVVDGGRVEVHDRGIGISDADRRRVFDRFYRSVDARSRPGSGLGLAIVQAVAESHGGRAEARPREGGGTTMLLELPTDDVPDED
ncbi:sensor histidine kinase [Actinomarinicola tropica]|uniref:histidine kinase n=1 Tax=Actinomarinicola tropica TaxID=2789776 RepID=A0A5Q2RQ14_9ACTN|nr:HAMP domain-containing sensor histidine kinase [Actinomarinicola tropica]QGG96217.1 HAMP domain-containing protein [Actinomarinicola tropica]